MVQSFRGFSEGGGERQLEGMVQLNNSLVLLVEVSGASMG